MSQSPPALVDHLILVQIRKTSGFDIASAAKKIGIKPELLERWELGAVHPTIKQLRKMARVYQRPLGLFFLPELPEEAPSIRDFRRLPNVSMREMSTALRFEIRIAWERREEAIDLSTEIGEELAVFSSHAHLNDDAELIAHRLRGVLGCTPTDQAHLQNKYQAFNFWRTATERLGILVFQTGGGRSLNIDPDEAHGFSIAEQPFPVIVINGADPPTARSFTLIHELTHVVLRNGGLCDLHYPLKATSEIDRVEVFCNHVAGAVLVPSGTLLANDIVTSHGQSPVWSDDELGKLSRYFWVSWEVVLRRLLILGRTSPTFYQHWRNENKDRFPGPQDKGKVRLKMSTRVIRRNGRLYPQLVLRALHEGHITAYEASSYFGAGAHYLKKIQDAVSDVRFAI